MPNTRRPIIFWASRRRPSLVMRGEQIAQELARLGYETEVRTGRSRKALGDVRNAIIFCVKSSPLFPGWLTARGNKLVHDVIDFMSLRGSPSNASAIVAGTDEMCVRMRQRTRNKIPVITIYHHADPGLTPHHAGENHLKLVYIGEKESSKYLGGQIPDLNLVSFKTTSDWREQARNFNAHFSARMDPNKSVIKLANVSVLKAVFLTGAEPGCVELLGKDYPYFFRNHEDLQMVLQDVQRLKETVGTALWKDARERIEAASSRLTIQAAGQRYRDLIENLA